MPMMKSEKYTRIGKHSIIRWMILLWTLTLYPSAGVCQKTFMVEKSGTTRHIFFHQGDPFKIRAAIPDTLLKGTLWGIGDSSVWVYGWRPVEIRIGDIQAVYKKFPVANYFGKMFSIAGITIFSIIGFNHLINNEQFFTPEMFIIAGSLGAMGGIAFSLSQKKYRIGARWKIKILEAEIYSR